MDATTPGQLAQVDDRLARRNAMVLAVTQALAGGNNTVLVATGGIVGSMLACSAGCCRWSRAAGAALWRMCLVGGWRGGGGGGGGGSGVRSRAGGGRPPARSPTPHAEGPPAGEPSEQTKST